MASEWGRLPSFPWAAVAFFSPGHNILICSAMPGLSFTHSCTNWSSILLRPVFKSLEKARKEDAPCNWTSIPTLLALWYTGHLSVDPDLIDGAHDLLSEWPPFMAGRTGRSDCRFLGKGRVVRKTKTAPERWIWPVCLYNGTGKTKYFHRQCFGRQWVSCSLPVLEGDRDR